VTVAKDENTKFGSFRFIESLLCHYKDLLYTLAHNLFCTGSNGFSRPAIIKREAAHRKRHTTSLLLSSSTAPFAFVALVFDC